MHADILKHVTRRHFFRDCGVGLGKMALASLLCESGSRLAQATETPSNPLAPRPPHYAPKVKSVIYLFMAGAPSQLDLFDNKPVLSKHEGKPVPAEIVQDQRYAFIRPDSTLLGPRFKFSKHGKSGIELSEVVPHLAEIVDEISVIKSMHTNQFNHAPAQILANSGSPLPGRPSMGSWVTYGLGSEANDLPAFVVLSTGGGTSGGAANWSNGFLPGIHAGVPLRSQGDPILFVSNPAGVSEQVQRESIDMIQQLNHRQHDAIGDPAIATRINAYETAYRMQSRAPELMDWSGETQETLDMYGAKPGQASFANNCLLARRLIERGVRFVNVYHKGWDHHSNVEGGLKDQCGQTDRACAALVKDLKQRGMLEDTLVVWGGEFGRTPMVEASAALGRSQGRDHHPQAFTMWLAGGGIKKGFSIGATDDLGFHITESPFHIHDMQATILHLLGMDHKRLTFAYQGREFRLTDVHGELIEPILA
jgi:uncharacterized protein (DUF1501 family)